MGRPSFLCDTNGAAAAEMALILPMAFALLFTTAEAGYYFQTEHKAVKYVREGARYAARQNFDLFDCSGAGAFDNSATNSAAVQGQIRNVTLTGQIAGGNARIANWEASDIAITVTCDGDYDTGLYRNIDDDSAPIVQVSTRFSHTPIFALLGFDIRNLDVVAQSQAAVVGL